MSLLANVLRDYINTTKGFAELAYTTRHASKSPDRALRSRPTVATATGLGSYPFLTPSVEIKKAIFMGFPRKQFWTGFLTPLPFRLGGHHAFEGSLARRQT